MNLALDREMQDIWHIAIDVDHSTIVMMMITFVLPDTIISSKSSSILVIIERK